MDLNRLTEKAQEALREAQGLAARRNNQGIDAEHLLLAMLAPAEGLAQAFLAAAGVDIPALQQRLSKELEKIPQVSGSAAGPEQIYVTQRLGQLLTKAEDEAKN